ncbi:MAG TPA: hypothetical protein VKV77_10770 [Methylovirgula sp.]|nr:hypothetical protein [Methylovirgula sp.]
MTEQENFQLLVECRNLLEYIEATLRARKQETDRTMLNAIEALIKKLPSEGLGG